jgi:hypothetical protein
MKIAKLVALFALALMPFGCSAGDPSDGSAGPVAEAENELSLKTCRSSADCRAPLYCTTEDGVCNRPPGCGPDDICPAVCYGTCSYKRIVLPSPTCGGNVCPKGTFCCNASCGTCAPLGGACTQQVCESEI